MKIVTCTSVNKFGVVTVGASPNANQARINHRLASYDPSNEATPAISTKDYGGDSD